MADTTRRIFAPLAPAASSGSSLMRSFNTGMAIFDGVMLGMKMIRKVRGLSGKDIKKNTRTYIIVYPGVYYYHVISRKSLHVRFQ